MRFVFAEFLGMIGGMKWQIFQTSAGYIYQLFLSLGTPQETTYLHDEPTIYF